MESIKRQDEQADEIARLREIVGRLPKTADGVPTVDGDEVWCVTNGKVVKAEVGINYDRWLCAMYGLGELNQQCIEDSYSTEAGAEAAREAK